MPKTFFATFRLRYSYLAFFLVFAAVALVLGIYHTGSNLPVPALLGKDLEDSIIVIDAGHGGADPGAVGATGTLEKEVDLAIAGRVAELLKMSGVKVIETRQEDKMIADTKTEDIHKRAKIATENDADLFITIHANSIPKASLHGAQVFYHPDSQEGFRLAGNIQAEITRIMENTDRKILAKKDIYLLKNLALPSVLVEVGFLSNEKEEELLKDSDYQNRMAWCIYAGIIDFFSGDSSNEEAFIVN